MVEQDVGLSSANVMALARGLEILRCFSAREPSLSNGELAVHTGLPKSTISRLTKTLVELGYLRHDARTRRYFIGPSVLGLGYAALSNLRVVDIARPFMQSLADATGALLSLAVRDRLSMIYIEACSNDGLLTLKMGRGVRMPIISTSIGRAFLAALPQNERHYLIDAIDQKSQTPVTAQQRASLDTEIARFEREGYCLSLGEWNNDVNAAATTIGRNIQDDIIVVSISGPSFLITHDLLKEKLIPRLMDLANHIARQLA